MTHRALIIHDEAITGEFIAQKLAEKNYVPEVIPNGELGINDALNASFDLVILDLIRNGEKSGLQILRTIRQKNNRVPVIILSDQNQEKVIVEALESGADEFVRKPFGMAEFMARVETVIRRTHKNKRPEQSAYSRRYYQIGELTISPDKYEVESSGQIIDLNPKEFQLLHFLSQRADLPLSRKVLLDSIWGTEYKGSPRIVNVYISSLRKKLEPHQNTIQIKRVQGIGYKLVLLNRN
ncbi:response regulator transcription factor [Paenibacillus macerans]|uniref:response regulator transcription factor n=1 Tax=Paenibacillus macerans TaxID=44252 RepID=UPI003D314E9D